MRRGRIKRAALFGRRIPTATDKSFQMWPVCYGPRPLKAAAAAALGLPAMMPSICSKAAANISLASDIIFSHLDGSGKSGNLHQFKQKTANTGLSARHFPSGSSKKDY